MSSIRELLSAAEGRNLAQVIKEQQAKDNDLTYEQCDEQIRNLLKVMKASHDCYQKDERSNSGLVGGEGAKVIEAYQEGKLLGGSYINEVIAAALKIAECNACMKRIVAAPTAGSCGVLPAVLLPLNTEEKNLIDALYIAAAFGEVAADRACIAGAAGGCQAEIGVASAMAAAALTAIMGGDGAKCADAFAIALSNLLGLVCDPIAGLVEVPCVKRNVTGALNAIGAANMVIAGCHSPVPVDEVIDAMGEVGALMHNSLKETGRGGLANTPTGKRIAAQLSCSNGCADRSAADPHEQD